MNGSRGLKFCTSKCLNVYRGLYPFLGILEANVLVQVRGYEDLKVESD